MLAITKEHEPNELTQYRTQSGAVYDGANFTETKQAIRNKIVREQGYLCAFCMSRIEPNSEKMKVAHWHPQATHPEEQLNYTNLLGCCLGNKGKSLDCQHCDTAQGKKTITYNPANPEHHDRLSIRFLFDGTIKSDDIAFNRDLNEVLNLNSKKHRLKANRKDILDKVIKQLSKLKGAATIQKLDTLIAKWNTLESDGRKAEYCGVAIYYLNKKRNRLISSKR